MKQDWYVFMEHGAVARVYGERPMVGIDGGLTIIRDGEVQLKAMPGKWLGYCVPYSGSEVAVPTSSGRSLGQA